MTHSKRQIRLLEKRTTHFKENTQVPKITSPLYHLKHYGNISMYEHILNSNYHSQIISRFYEKEIRNFYYPLEGRVPKRFLLGHRSPTVQMGEGEGARRKFGDERYAVRDRERKHVQRLAGSG